MKITIFGAGGFIGSHLMNALLAKGHKVIGFDRDFPIEINTNSHNATFVTGDFLQHKDWIDLLKESDICYHLISTTIPSTSNADPIRDLTSNVPPTIKMLERLKGTTTKLIFSSSGGTVYGESTSSTLAEHMENFPLCSYGITKLTIEKYLNLYSKLYGLNAVSLRLANPYGEHQRMEALQGAVPVFIKKILTGEPIEIWGDGTIERDFIYISDVVDAFILAMENKNRFSIFNVGSGMGTSLNQLISKIEFITNNTAKIKKLPVRGLDVEKNILNIDLIKNKLNWKPTTSLEYGLRRTIDWAKSTLIANHADADDRLPHA